MIGNYIFGLPEDDLETMQETLDLALELNCEFANFYCAMAYPGSLALRARAGRGLAAARELGRLLAAQRRLAPAADAPPHGRPRCCASATTPSRPTSSTRRTAQMVERTFGPAVLGEIDAMTAHRLERRFAA